MPPKSDQVRLPGIEPGSSAWEAPMITITLQAPWNTSPGRVMCATAARAEKKIVQNISQEGLEPPIF